MSLSLHNIHPLLLHMGLGVHNADWNWKDVCSPFMRIYYVTEGHAEVHLDANRILSLRPAHLYLIPSFARHSYVCDSPFSHYYIHIYEDYGEGTRLEDQYDLPLELEATPLELPLIERLHALNPHAALPSSDPDTYDNPSGLTHGMVQRTSLPLPDQLETTAILQMLLAHFLRQATPRTLRDERIEAAVGRIRSHVNEPLDVTSLAAEACMTADHFIRLFKREEGLTPLQYINQKKIERAQLLLVATSWPVKRVAQQLAFDDYSYFCRLFKKTTGLTPQLYRQAEH